MILVKSFLMYRVELKVDSVVERFVKRVVPNVPCGVERYFRYPSLYRRSLFLMYRVELKAKVSTDSFLYCPCS